MSKRKVAFEEEEYDFDKVPGSGIAQASRFKGKHSLDSDEEDDEKDDEKDNILDEDEIEGQEETTVTYDEGTSITPFNMRDEMDEGHFDRDGTYIFDRQTIRDNWIDNIDWVKIQERKKDENDGDDDDDDDLPEIDKDSIYRGMVELLQPGESINKALRRLGGGSKFQSASQKLKAKKQKLKGIESESPENTESRESFLKLTSLADQMLSSGMMDIYDMTYERLTFTIKMTDDAKFAEKVQIPDGTEDDDALDMFADDLDKGAEKVLTAEGDHENTTDVKVSAIDDDSVLWDYKDTLDDDATLHGPYTTEQMIIYKENGTWPEGGVFCRKRSGQGPYYNSNRIDFDLYT